MPELRNFTPFPNFRYYSSDNKGEDFGVIIVKGTYILAPSGRLLVAEEQAPMVFTDKCHGEVNVSSLWHPSDLVPNKPRTDIIVNAVARAEKGQSQPSWTCGVQVEREGRTLVSKVLTVTGPRRWLPKWKRCLNEEEKREWRKHRDAFDGWELSAPEPITELPLRYELAYGGLLQRGAAKNGQPVIDDNHFNPIGRGWIDREWSDHTQEHPAPQIEAADEPITDAYRIYKPQGLGPIPPAWEPRLPLGGTYDQNWMDNIWPAWPPDYSFAYHNSANPDLICPTLLNGDERIRLMGFYADRRVMTFTLPNERPTVDLVREDGSTERKPMQLDTVFLDLAEPSLRDARIYLSWRVNFTPNEFEEIQLFSIAEIKSATKVRVQLGTGKAA